MVTVVWSFNSRTATSAVGGSSFQNAFALGMVPVKTETLYWYIKFSMGGLHLFKSINSSSFSSIQIVILLKCYLHHNRITINHVRIKIWQRPCSTQLKFQLYYEYSNAYTCSFVDFLHSADNTTANTTKILCKQSSINSIGTFQQTIKILLDLPQDSPYVYKYHIKWVKPLATCITCLYWKISKASSR